VSRVNKIKFAAPVKSNFIEKNQKCFLKQNPAEALHSNESISPAGLLCI